MSVLGGRSPYEVVTGMVPRLPRAPTTDGPIEDMSVDTYSGRLVAHMRNVHQSLIRIQEAALDRDEAVVPGSAEIA